MACYYKIVSIAVLVTVLTLHVAEGITCVTCRGNEGSSCLLTPEKEVHTLQCEKCAVFARLYKINNEFYDIQRDCYNRIFPAPIPEQYANTCKDDNSQYIECTHTCDSADLCNNNISYAPPGWNEDGTKSGGGNVLSSYALIMLLLLAIKLIVV